MKKLLLPAAIMAILAPAAVGANFKVSYCPDSELKTYHAVANGDVVEISNVETIYEGYEYEIPCYFRVENTSGSSLNMSFTVACDADATTLDVPDGVSYCYPGSCAPYLPFTGSWAIPAGGKSDGAAFHVAYSIGGPENETLIDLTSSKYVGSWVGTVKAVAGGETCEFTLVLSNLGAGVDGVAADSNAKAVYYTLQGVRVDNPTSGNIYIKRQGSKAVKVLM